MEKRCLTRYNADEFILRNEGLQLMNRRLFAASTAACIVVTAVYPMTSLAAVNMDLKKKVVGMAGIMNVTNTEKNVTRAEYAKMVVLASPYGSSVPPEGSSSVFADVGKDHAYASYIKTAVEKGYMTGYLGACLNRTRTSHFRTRSEAFWHCWGTRMKILLAARLEEGSPSTAF